MVDNFYRNKLDFSSLQVLVAEDNLHMRRVLRALLIGMGVGGITEAEDGASALERISCESIDIVITDWEMPVVDGLELVRHIRNPKSSPDPYLPIIMLSGHASKARVLEARDTGITEFLCKPISAATLYARLANCMMNPRPFVRTNSFFGPDRRRFVNPSYGGDERRLESEDTSVNVA